MSKARILIVEDDKDLAATTGALLQAAGYAIIGIADSGEGGLRLAQESPPDLILMDVRLNGSMDGIEAAAHIRAGLAVPVVFVTAFADEDLVRRAGTTGAFGYLLKPVQSGELFAAVEIALERHRLERRLAESEQALRESEERFRAALRNSPIMVFEQDLDLRYTWVHNPPPGTPAEHFLGRTDSQLLDSIEDIERVEPLKRRVIESGQGAHESLWLSSAGGRVLYDLTVEPRRNRQGAITGLSGTAVNLTERKRAEEAMSHLAAIVESSDAAIIARTLDGRIESWNPAAERLYGYTAAEAIGQPISILTPPEFAHEPPLLRARLARGESIRHLETTRMRKDGSRVEVRVNLVPLRDRSRVIVGVSSISEDSTELHRLEAELMQAEKLASLGIMASGIAHEVRNPLAVIASAACLMEECAGDAQLQQECIERIVASAHRAGQIIDDLLQYAKPHNGSMHPVDLPGVLRQTLRWVGQRLAQQKVTLKTDIPESLPAVLGSSGLLQQVFINLIINAIEAMPQGGMLAVGAHLVETGEVSIQFTDTGHGIRPEHLTRIFDPFYTTRPAGQGTGLGLALSYSIVRQHGGRIDVHSQVGQGSVFSVLLPAYAGDGQAAEVEERDYKRLGPAGHARERSLLE